MTKKQTGLGSDGQSGVRPAASPELIREPASPSSRLPASSLLLPPSPLEIATRAGQRTLTRTAILYDLDQANEMHDRCSLESRFARYYTARKALTASEWRRLCDRANGTTLVTFPLHEPSRIIAITHLLRTSIPHVRELGILVEDSWQGLGLGTALARYAVDLARTHTLDCHEIAAMTGSGNQRMLSILRRLHARVTDRSGSTLDTMIQVEA